jgi:hypothetical protein
MPEYNRFDIVEAHYWYCVNYHGGRWSDEYERLCHIGEYFKPGACSHGPSTENSKAIYRDLVQKGNLV